MKKIFTLLFWGVCRLPALTAFGQTPPNGKVANFGIDGDVLSDFNLANSLNQTGTHDWFKSSSATATGVIDTTGAANAFSRLLTGENYVFDRGMLLPRYSVQDGYVLLDARYGRDYFGLSGGRNSDLTSFGPGSKNGNDPAAMATTPQGAPVTSKADIIDSYVHMRRDGSIVNGASSSHLIAMMGASTVANTGNRYFDAEFFCSAINYNASTGVFSNSGPASTGGHTAWSFNADGSIKNFGDLSVAFSFSGNVFADISLWVWVSVADYNSVNPQGFDFVPGEFYGGTSGVLYGYAKIQANAGNSMQVWGAVNSSVTSAPSWGTCSSSLGSNNNNYDSQSYDVGQLGEAAVDLTALGIDPALIPGLNACSPPFKRVLIKSRASSSFTSDLKDFAGPYYFLDAPTANAAIATPAVLNCTNSSATLSPQSTQPGNYYHWSTTNGSIGSNPDSVFVVVNKPGKYYLQTAVYTGCPSNTDSVEVLMDTLKPVATSSTSGFLNNDLGSTITLLGGDPVASNVITPFGGSKGLSYSWNGPNGFDSATRYPVTSLEGKYELTVTERRNGCKSSASVVVVRMAAGALLPVAPFDVQGNLQGDNVNLNWTILENEILDRFEVERSYDGTDFTTVGMVFGSQKAGVEYYGFSEKIKDAGLLFYRLKIYDQSQAIHYSKTLRFQSKTCIDKTISVKSNVVSGALTVSFQSDKTQPIFLMIVDMSGRMLMKVSAIANKGSNLINLPLAFSINPGVYVVQILWSNERLVSKFIKQ